MTDAVFLFLVKDILNGILCKFNKIVVNVCKLC